MRHLVPYSEVSFETRFGESHVQKPKPSAKKPTTPTILGELTLERYRTSDQYRLQLDAEPSVKDTKHGVSSKLPVVLMQDTAFREMIAGLAKVANQRVVTFDHLLNSHEALGCVMRFLIERLPEVFSSGMLQGLIDLDDCFHKLVVRSDPAIVVNRDKRFDGGFRTIEGSEEVKSTGGIVRDVSSNPVRLPKDMHEARIVLAYRAVLEGSPEGAKNIMRNLLRTHKIRTLDDKNDRPVLVDQVISWSEYVEIADKSLGRRYSWDFFKLKYRDELLACKDPKEGLAFAARVLNEARWRQPTTHAELGIE